MKSCCVVHSADKAFVPHPQYRGVYIKSVIDEEISRGVKVTLVNIVPGGQIEPHVHDTLEVFYILSGYGNVYINGEAQAVVAGSCIYAPAGQVHSLLNSAEATLTLLASFPKVKE